MIRRAVVLAAGRGTRLGALTAAVPKPLLELGGRPILVGILEGLAAAGIAEAAVVTGYRAAQVEAAAAVQGPPGLALRFFRQERLEGTARALALARAFTAGEPFFFAWGDIVVEPANYAAVIAAAGDAAAVIAVNEVDDPWAGAAIYMDGAGWVERIVEKPPPGTSATHWNNAGFGVLGPAIWPAIERLEPSARGEWELPRALATLVDGGERVRAVPVCGPWFDVGTPEDLAAARAAAPGLQARSAVESPRASGTAAARGHDR